MDKASVIAFFDRLAPEWDAHMVRNEAVIATILDNACVQPGRTVLDVACGTGVLIPDELARGAVSVCGIDISPEMAKIASGKFSDDDRVTILCGDVETQDFGGKQFDCIVVYNAFPHFPEPERLIARLAGLLNPGGVLTVAHGMSRDKINAHHSGSASPVSRGLPDAESLAAIFARYLSVTTILSDDTMYQVAGRKE